LKSNKDINFFNIGLNFKDQLFLCKHIMSGKSFMRATHNLFLKKYIKLNSLTGDLGSGGKSDYNKFIFDKSNLIKNFDFYKTNKDTIKLNLEKNFNLRKYKLKNILIFNVFEHIYEKEVLIKSISKSLNKNGKLEVFVPFMYRYHGDPNDYYRFTHLYLKKFLEKNGFRVKITLIGAGQLNVILEILYKYFKLDILKIIISPIFILVNKIFYFTSKDFKNYYCGIHCSCIKN
jgi:hypothetical protein